MDTTLHCNGITIEYEGASRIAYRDDATGVEAAMELQPYDPDPELGHGSLMWVGAHPAAPDTVTVHAIDPEFAAAAAVAAGGVIWVINTGYMGTVLSTSLARAHHIAVESIINHRAVAHSRGDGMF